MPESDEEYARKRSGLELRSSIEFLIMYFTGLPDDHPTLTEQLQEARAQDLIRIFKAELASRK